MNDVTNMEIEIGAAIRRMRIRRGLSLDEAAARANLSQAAVRSLELGRGSTLRTMVKLFFAIDETRLLTEWIESTNSFSPIAVFRETEKKAAYPKRVSRKRAGNTGEADR